VKVRNQTGIEYFNAWNDLEDRKIKLYAAGNFKQWGIDPEKYCIDKKTLKSNKTIAVHLMLPNQSQMVKRMGKVFGYFNHQLLD
jgi:hypothetical protein